MAKNSFGIFRNLKNEFLKIQADTFQIKQKTFSSHSPEKTVGI
jgi:hypothetical protein